MLEEEKKLSDKAMGWISGESEFRSWQVKEIILFSTESKLALQPTQSPIQGKGSLPRSKMTRL
jgi:hypothetical protein